MEYYSIEQTEQIHLMNFAYIKVMIKDHVLTITLARPQAKNAMSPTMIREYGYAMNYAHHQPDIWAVVFEAEGDIWCAGADLKAMRGHEEANSSTVPLPAKEIVIGDLFARIHKPVIAKVHAPVYAGGFLLIGGATYVVASENAKFSLPEVKRGIFPFQVMALLIQNLPMRQVIDFCLRAKTASAQEALAMGLITHLVPHDTLDNAVQSIISELFENSPSAIRLGLKALDEMRAIAPHEQQAFLKKMLDECIQTADAQEGLKAFAEKRKPNWIGK
jgi:enoyl-CoA hydratase/carnithine racemase